MHIIACIPTHTHYDDFLFECTSLNNMWKRYLFVYMHKIKKKTRTNTKNTFVSSKMFPYFYNLLIKGSEYVDYYLSAILIPRQKNKHNSFNMNLDGAFRN